MGYKFKDGEVVIVCELSVLFSTGMKSLEDAFASKLLVVDDNILYSRGVTLLFTAC
jgi:hypothetical protein